MALLSPGPDSGVRRLAPTEKLTLERPSDQTNRKKAPRCMEQGTFFFPWAKRAVLRRKNSCHVSGPQSKVAPQPVVFPRERVRQRTRASLRAPEIMVVTRDLSPWLAWPAALCLSLLLPAGWRRWLTLHATRQAVSRRLEGGIRRWELPREVLCLEASSYHQRPWVYCVRAHDARICMGAGGELECSDRRPSCEANPTTPLVARKLKKCGRQGLKAHSDG